MTGLTAARILQQHGVPVRVFEAAPRSGGTLALGGKEGFYFDAGIHVIHTSDPGIISFLEDNLGLELTVSNRRALFAYNGKLMPYPYQVNTYCLSLIDRLRVIMENMRPHLKTPANYGEFLSSYFGPTLTRYFFAPYTRKFWTVDPHELSLDWVEGRVPIPRMQHRLQGLFWPVTGNYGPNQLFYYPKQGMAALAEALSAPLQEHIFCNTRVNAIFHHERKLHCNQGEEYLYDICISTLPLPHAVKMLQPLPLNLVERAAGLRHTAMCCINIALQGKLPHEYHWVYFPSRDEPIARVHFPGNISATNTPPGYCSLQIEIPYRGSFQSPKVKEGFVHDCLNRLESMALIRKNRENIFFVEQHQIDPAYVIHDHYRTKYLPEILENFRRSGIIPAGRFGLWGYHWMHDSIYSGQEAAAEVLASKS